MNRHKNTATANGWAREKWRQSMSAFENEESCVQVDKTEERAAWASGVNWLRHAWNIASLLCDSTTNNTKLMTKQQSHCRCNLHWQQALPAIGWFCAGFATNVLITGSYSRVRKTAKCIHCESEKNCATFLLSVSLPNVNKFSQFFHLYIQWTISNNVVIDYPSTL